MSKREYKFGVNTKRVIKIGLKNGLIIPDIRVAEQILKRVAFNVDANLDRVILAEIKKFISPKVDHSDKMITPEDVNTEIKEEIIDQPAEEVAEEEELVLPTEDEEEEVEYKSSNPNRCPVCDRGCTSRKKLEGHLRSRSKKCFKHAEYVKSLANSK